MLSRVLCAGFWMDVGQPADYLTGMCMYLHSNHKVPASLPEGTVIHGNVLIVRCTDIHTCIHTYIQGINTYIQGVHAYIYSRDV